MLLQVLSRKDDGCRAMQQLIRDRHETPKQKQEHRKREFTALTRIEIFHFLRALAAGRYATAALLVPPWIGEELCQKVEEYFVEHERILLDPETRNHKHTYITPDDENGVWHIDQVLVDPDELNDWQLSFTVDKALAKQEGKPILQLRDLAPISDDRP